MFHYGIVLVAVFGINSVTADTHSCTDSVLAEKKTIVDDAVAEIVTIFTPIITDQNTPMEMKTAMILNMICNDTTPANQKVKVIETELATCQALINMTTVTTIELGTLGFLDLFENFHGVDNFCRCVPVLMQAMTIAMKAAMLKHSMTNAKYPVINVGVICTSMDVKEAVNAVADNTDVASSQCPNVWKYGEILDKQNIKLMSSFAKEQCPSFDQTKFDCAVSASTSITFKNCIMDAEKSSTDNQKRCGRHTCAMNMTTSCNVGRVWYMHATNMDKDNGRPFQLDAKLCETNSAAMALASISLLLISVVFSLF